MTSATTADFDAWLTFAVGPDEKLPGGEEGGMSLDTGVNNPTWRGIALDEWQRWREDESLNGGDMQRMLWRTEIGELTRTNYWQKFHVALLPSGPDVLYMDGVFNGGGVYALQLAINQLFSPNPALKMDNDFGTITLGVMPCVTGIGPLALISALYNGREEYYRRLAKFPQYGADWLGRLGRCMTLSKQLAGAPATTGDNA